MSAPADKMLGLASGNAWSRRGRSQRLRDIVETGGGAGSWNSGPTVQAADQQRRGERCNRQASR